jgi:hypothetical protein
MALRAIGVALAPAAAGVKKLLNSLSRELARRRS